MVIHRLRGMFSSTASFTRVSMWERVLIASVSSTVLTLFSNFLPIDLGCDHIHPQVYMTHNM